MMGRSEWVGWRPARGFTSIAHMRPRLSARTSTRPASRHSSALHDPSGGVSFVSCAMEREGVLYTGSYRDPSIVAVLLGACRPMNVTVSVLEPPG